MISLISSLLSAVLRGLIDLFRISPEQKLGRAEINLENASKENAVLKSSLDISNSVDNNPNIDKLRGKLNRRP